MGFEVPDYCIFQGRWWAEDEDTPNYVRWSPWINIPEWEYKEMLDHIRKGSGLRLKGLEIQYNVASLAENSSARCGLA